MSLALTPGRVGRRPEPRRSWVGLEQRLGREDHLDLARPDPERERSESAVGAVRVAAHNRHPGLGQPELGSDDVDDALARVADAMERDPNSAQLASNWLTWPSAIASMNGRLRSVVGIEWLVVATVWPGRRTPDAAGTQPGEPAGWSLCGRWKSTARTAGHPGPGSRRGRTRILSTMVRGPGAVIGRAYQTFWGPGTQKERPEGRSDQTSRWVGGDPGIGCASGRRHSLAAGSRPWSAACRGTRRTSVRQCHFIPAPSDRAMVARSDRATAKRARFAFTTPPHRSRFPPALSCWRNSAVSPRRNSRPSPSPPHDGFALDGGPSP